MQTKKKEKGVADLLKVARGFCVHFSLCECLSALFVNIREDGSTQHAKIVLELGTGGASWSRVGTSLTLLPPAMSLLGATSSGSWNEADSDKIGHLPTRTASLQSENELGHLDHAFGIPRSLMFCASKEYVI